MAASAWQTKLSSFEGRNLYAYNKSLFCDVELSVMDANGDKVTIPAHKYVLAISSPVFEAMVYGELAETGRTIDVPDCTKEALQEMLRYVYADEVNLTGSNVLEVLYLAEKYMLPFLKIRCKKYLEKELKPEDVFHVLPKIRNEKVEEKCWKMLDSDTETAVSSESFLNVSKEMLCKALGKNTLTIDEVVLFEAVEKWALKKVKQEGLEENMENKRAVLGEDVTKLIRFPLMSQKEFAEMVLPSRILNMDEVIELIQLFNGVAPLKGSFSNRKRGKHEVLVPRNRFISVITPNTDYPRWFVRTNYLDFKISSPLYLVGVRLFGNIDTRISEHPLHKVTLALHQSHTKIQQISSNVHTENEMTDGYYGYTIYLDDPVPLEPDVVYTIEATIKGPPSYYGLEYESTITFEVDIVITYLDSAQCSNNCTASITGQFPTLLFKKYI